MLQFLRSFFSTPAKEPAPLIISTVEIPSNLKRCGNCDNLCSESICRATHSFYLTPKMQERLPKGVVLDRMKMRPEDGEGCNFWKGRLDTHFLVQIGEQNATVSCHTS